MKLISSIEVKNFRSLESAKLENLGNFSVLAGMNNSGKSNFLRAINCFFSGNSEPNLKLNPRTEYFRPGIKSKKKKSLSIKIEFNLPEIFNFRSGLDDVHHLLGDKFSIRKQWSYSNSELEIFLNDDRKPLTISDQYKVEQFLSLISFRYIPNRVLPIDVLRDQNEGLRDLIFRRLGNLNPKDDFFNQLQEKSNSLIKSISTQNVFKGCNINSIRLNTPRSLTEMLFSFGFLINENGFELDDIVQGSGVQSYLMYQILYLIDKDYFQKFGWRQASIWAVEEPESSQHKSLEAQVASFLSKISDEKLSRMQVISTTHSELLIQRSDACYYVVKNENKTSANQMDVIKLLRTTMLNEVSKWTHPLLFYSHLPLLLVEGKTDKFYLEKVLENIGRKDEVYVCCLEELTDGNANGGEEIKNYIKSNVSTIKSRKVGAPVIVIYDWDKASIKNSLSKHFNSSDPFKIAIWPEEKCNKELSDRFKGVERFLPTNIIQMARDDGENIFQKNDGIYTVDPEEYNRSIKRSIYNIAKLYLAPKDMDSVKNYFKHAIFNEEVQESFSL